MSPSRSRFCVAADFGGRSPTIDLRALARIGGDLRVEEPERLRVSAQIDVGLAALTHVAGTSSSASINSTPSLTGWLDSPACGGNLTLEFRNGDAFASALLDNLARVQGNVTMRAESTVGGSCSGWSRWTERAVGPARLMSGAGPDIGSHGALRALARVSGDFSYQGEGLARGALSALARVDGGLRFERPVPDFPAEPPRERHRRGEQPHCWFAVGRGLRLPDHPGPGVRTASTPAARSASCAIPTCAPAPSSASSTPSGRPTGWASPPSPTTAASCPPP